MSSLTIGWFGHFPRDLQRWHRSWGMTHRLSNGDIIKSYPTYLWRSSRSQRKFHLVLPTLWPWAHSSQGSFNASSLFLIHRFRIDTQQSSSLPTFFGVLKTNLRLFPAATFSGIQAALPFPPRAPPDLSPSTWCWPSPLRDPYLSCRVEASWLIWRVTITAWWCNFTILKNDGVRQWEGWHPIYEMENKTGSKPPTRPTWHLSSFFFLEHGSLC